MDGHQSLSLGRKPIIWQDFHRKLLENEEIGKGESLVPVLGYANKFISAFWHRSISCLTTDNLLDWE